MNQLEIINRPHRHLTDSELAISIDTNINRSDYGSLVIEAARRFVDRNLPDKNDLSQYKKGGC